MVWLTWPGGKFLAGQSCDPDTLIRSVKCQVTALHPNLFLCFGHRQFIILSQFPLTFGVSVSKQIVSY